MLQTQDLTLSPDVLWDRTGLSSRGWGGQPCFVWREWPEQYYGAGKLMYIVVGYHFWSFVVLLNLSRGGKKKKNPGQKAISVEL